MSPKAKRIARRLLRMNRGTRTKHARSWRTIAREDFNDQINNTTLCRFAISEGEWLPKNKQLLIVLGLKHERKAHPSPEPLSTPRIIHTLRKLGWLDEARVSQ